MQNYFELFGLLPCFTIDLKKLEVSYQRVQSIVHPDKFALASQAEKRSAMQLATLANDAYTVLKNPLKRAIYLCKLNGLDPDDQRNSQMPTSFLMQQMDLRETLENAKKQDQHKVLENLYEQQQTQREKQIDRIAQLLDKKNFSECILEIKKLMFLEKFIEEIRNIINQLH